jgi:hypothetical protein
MAYARVNESGCQIVKGLLRVRLDMYLDAGDPGYDEHYVSVPDETSAEFQKGYAGDVDESGRPKDQAAFKAWRSSLPHVWQHNPFVSHFAYVDHEITEGDLKAMAASLLGEFLAGRKAGETPFQTWASRKRVRLAARVLSMEQQVKAAARLDAVKALSELKLGGIDAKTPSD